MTILFTLINDQLCNNYIVKSFMILVQVTEVICWSILTQYTKVNFENNQTFSYFVYPPPPKNILFNNTESPNQVFNNNYKYLNQYKMLSSYYRTQTFDNFLSILY